MRHHRHPESDTLAGMFHKASRLLARAFHRGDRGHHAQHRVLSIILERGTMPQSELLEILDVRSSSLSELMTKLENQGLITRARSEKDKRGFDVTATQKARDEFTGHADDTADTDLFSCLDETEQEQLKAILEKLIASNKDDLPCERHGRGPGGHSGDGEERGEGRGRRGKGHGGGGRGPGGQGRGGRGRS